MKYLKSSFLILVALFIATATYSQDNKKMSDLKNFKGIWKFVPPEGSNDTTFIGIQFIFSNKNIDLTYWKNTRKCTIIGPLIIGFANFYDEIHRLSDLKERGNRLFFFENKTDAPNDSIKYYHEASPSCFASFNGEGTDYCFHKKEDPNFLLLNFNGRDDEILTQLTHLPNFIVKALKEQNPGDWDKVRQLLPHEYKLVQSKKAPIYSSPEVSTQMYLIKGDVVEILEEKGDWLRVNYYPEKDGKETGKTIEGWIKKTDVE